MQVFLPAGVKQQDHNRANLTTQDSHIKLWNLSASDFRAPGSVQSSTILFYFLLTVSPYISLTISPKQKIITHVRIHKKSL